MNSWEDECSHWKHAVIGKQGVELNSRNLSTIQLLSTTYTEEIIKNISLETKTKQEAEICRSLFQQYTNRYI